MKKVARYQQFRAAERIARRVVEAAVQPPAQPNTQDLTRGIIWHTQGSGKTLTMVFTAYELRKRPELNDPTVYIVVDRKDLKTQVGDTFELVSFPNTTRPLSIGDLKAKIRQRPAEVVITTIQKFRDLLGDPDFVPDDRGNVIVLIDEAHRTQYGLFHSELRAAFPNAKWFAFTGTPTLKTHRRFGAVAAGRIEPYLDRYSIEDAIKDGATVPVHYTYGPQELWLDRDQLKQGWNEITADLDDDEKQAVQRRVQPWKEFLKGKERIARLAQDVAEDYRAVVEPNGFKAQLVVVDKLACRFYYDELLKHFRPSELQVVISQTTKMAGEQEYRLLKDFNLTDAELKEVISRFRRRVTDAERKAGTDLKVLIVCNMLLTGFDAPIEQTMYLDSPLRDHNLLQAIARTNRPYDDAVTGVSKQFGRIVDYVGVFKDYRESLAYEPEDLPAFASVDEIAAGFPKLLAKGMSYFDGIALEDSYECSIAIVRRLHGIDQIQFEKDFRAVVQAYEALSPHKLLATPEIKDSYDWLLTIFRIYVSEFRRTDFDAEFFAAKTRQLIRDSSRLKGFAGHLPEIAIDDRYIETLRYSRLSPSDKAEKIARDVETIIRNHESESPVYLDFDARLQELLRRRQEAQQDVEELLLELEQLYREIDEVSNLPTRMGFSDRGQFDLYLEIKHSTGERFIDTVARHFVERLVLGLKNRHLRVGWQESEIFRSRVATDIRTLGDADEFAALGISEDRELVEALLKRCIQHYAI
jgi:type I restriction enzyme R subunit